MTTITFDRSNLRATYLAVVDGFAVSTKEVADAAKLSKDEIQPLLRELQRTGLIVANHVNGAKAITWQSMFDVENVPNARKQAVKSFQNVYGQRGSIERQARQGATGPRYTDEQVQKAIAMRIAGESWKAIGAALGIKATAYLSKLLTPQIEAQKAVKGVDKANAKARQPQTPKRTVRVKATK
jgi:hypothetical protein